MQRSKQWKLLWLSVCVHACVSPISVSLSIFQPTKEILMRHRGICVSLVCKPPDYLVETTLPHSQCLQTHAHAFTHIPKHTPEFLILGLTVTRTYALHMCLEGVDSLFTSVICILTCDGFCKLVRKPVFLPHLRRRWVRSYQTQGVNDSLLAQCIPKSHFFNSPHRHGKKVSVKIQQKCNKGYILAQSSLYKFPHTDALGLQDMYFDSIKSKVQ